MTMCVEDPPSRFSAWTHPRPPADSGWLITTAKSLIRTELDVPTMTTVRGFTMHKADRRAKLSRKGKRLPIHDQSRAGLDGKGDSIFSGPVPGMDQLRLPLF